MSEAFGGGRWPPKRLVALRLVMIGLGLGAWFATQALIGARTLEGVNKEQAHAASRVISAGDGVFRYTEALHGALADGGGLDRNLLVVSSLVIDVLGLFLLGWAVLGRSFRPFVGLLILFALRQAAQALCALPAPEGMIWYDPGFPSLLVTYGVANDFFFSGHTAIAVYACTEIARLPSRWWLLPAWGIALFEIGTVLCLRAHYTMDVFTGILAALLVATWMNRLGPWADARLSRLCGPMVPGAAPASDHPA